MRTPTLVSSAAAFALVAALAGCSTTSSGGNGGLSAAQPSASVPVSGLPSAPGVPSGAASTAATTTTTATSTPTHTVAVPTYGTTSQQYATISVNAYVNRNATLLADYVDPDEDAFTHLGHPDQHWHYHGQAPDGVYTLVTFDNNVGDRLKVDVDPNLLGKPHAIHTVSIDRVEFANTPDDSVSLFMEAWETGNKYRMITLATSSVANQFDLSHVPNNSMVTGDDTTTEPGHTLVSVYTDIGSFVLDITNSRLGHAHAITGKK